MQLFHILAFAAVAFAQDLSTKRVKDAFNKAHIPQDIGINFNPSALLEVAFPVRDSFPVVVHAGEHVPVNSTAGPPIFTLLSLPSISSHSRPKHSEFVIIAIDPDAPSPQEPIFGPVRHFLGGDFSPLKLGPFGLETPLLVNSTPAISEFLQPGPPAGSDPHRYIFLAYNQPKGFDQQKLVTPQTNVLNWDLKDFVDGVGLGDPIAGTYMLVSADF
ncbi:hypothetical protein D9756_008063 [Leucocoprinus leucothites]|uniref:PEBP-like protein n=1 Tax=Leucocoprinus leucothites TaxID=201217 RepID=A0A8H5D4C0_9AGAR|nr:hypothetical protein D9756_008063 [Leucoagaricus leucothites]